MTLQPLTRNSSWPQGVCASTTRMIVSGDTQSTVTWSRPVLGVVNVWTTWVLPGTRWTPLKTISRVQGNEGGPAGLEQPDI
jgi:hypothetical protein